MTSISAAYLLEFSRGRLSSHHTGVPVHGLNQLPARSQANVHNELKSLESSMIYSMAADCKQDENKNKFYCLFIMVLGLSTCNQVPAGHLAGRKHNTLSADLCNGNKTSGFFRLITCGLEIEKRLGEPGRGK